MKKLFTTVMLTLALTSTMAQQTVQQSADYVPTKENLEEATKIRKNLESLRVEDCIKEATELESRYMEAISKLEPLDRTIILDGYINGKAYWKIGRDTGYTERGVQKRVVIAIETLANYI